MIWEKLNKRLPSIKHLSQISAPAANSYEIYNFPHSERHTCEENTNALRARKYLKIKRSDALIPSETSL